MLEVVNPMLGMPKGRFYYTGANRNQKGYELVNDKAVHAQKRAEFDQILSNFPPMLADDEYWNTNQGSKFFTSYTSESEKAKHLYNHKDYKFYEENVDNLSSNILNIQEFELYPNPVVTNCTISFTSKNSFSGLISIMDLKGKEVYSEAHDFPFGYVQITLDISELQIGGYLLAIQNENGKLVNTQQLLKH